MPQAEKHWTDIPEGPPYIPVVENEHLERVRVSRHNWNTHLKIFTVVKIFFEKVMCRKVKQTLYTTALQILRVLTFLNTRDRTRQIALCVPFVTCKSVCLYILQFALFQTWWVSMCECPFKFLLRETSLSRLQENLLHLNLIWRYGLYFSSTN